MEHTRFYRQMPEAWQAYLRLLKSRERKSALRLLDEIVRDGNDALCVDALALAAENGCTDTDSIHQCYYMIARKEFGSDPLKLVSTALMLDYHPDLSAYDGLTGGGDVHV